MLAAILKAVADANHTHLELYDDRPCPLAPLETIRAIQGANNEVASDVLPRHRCHSRQALVNCCDSQLPRRPALTRRMSAVRARQHPPNPSTCSPQILRRAQAGHSEYS